jgi:hypothetical protein
VTIKSPGYVTCHEIVAVELDKHAILGKLLLDENDFFCAPGDEIAARIERALVHLCQLHLTFIVQVALIALEHDGYTTDDEIFADDSLATTRIFNVYGDLG